MGIIAQKIEKNEAIDHMITQIEPIISLSWDVEAFRKITT